MTYDVKLHEIHIARKKVYIYTFVHFRNGHFVADVDECSSSDKNDCSLNAECINEEGSFSCICLENFSDLSPAELGPGRVCGKANDFLLSWDDDFPRAKLENESMCVINKKLECRHKPGCCFFALSHIDFKNNYC